MVFVIHTKSQEKKQVKIIRLRTNQIAEMDSARFWFDWSEEIRFGVFALRFQETGEYLGLMSLEDHIAESRIEIRLLAAARENVGKEKVYHRVVTNLIAYACRQSLEKYGSIACVSLIPKTELREYYKRSYGMFDAGISLCLDGQELIDLITRCFYNE